MSVESLGASRVGFGSGADLGEARFNTNQDGLCGCTPLVAVRRFQPLHRARSNSDARMAALRTRRIDDVRAPTEADKPPVPRKFRPPIPMGYDSLGGERDPYPRLRHLDRLPQHLIVDLDTSLGRGEMRMAGQGHDHLRRNARMDTPGYEPAATTV